MIKEGSKVSLHYKLTVDDEVIDTSDEKEPFTYTAGQSEIIPGLEEELAGLKPGDKKSIILPPERAYGEYDEEALQEVPMESFPDANELTVGDVVSGEIEEQPFEATVVEIEDDQVILDMNHPLAGQTLQFDVEIVGIEE